MIGPVQVVVVGFEQPRMTGEVLAEFARLRDAGVVQLIDVLVATRVGGGAFETVDIHTAESGFTGRVVAALLGVSDDDEGDGVHADVIDITGAARWSLADSVPEGATVVVGLVEHLWARGLADAIVRAGGTPLEEAWLAPEDRARVEQLLAVSS